MISVLFVCLGNICRSPAAEGVFLDLLNKKSLREKFHIDSAGTSAHHIGERADQRMRSHAAKRSIELPSISRKLVAEDFDKFSYIVVMDESNYRNTIRLAQSEDDKHKVLKMADFTPSYSQGEIPDPYYGGASGFELVLDMLEEGCEKLLTYLMKKEV